MDLPNPSVVVALYFVEKGIAEGVFEPGRYLPAVAVLARQAGVGMVSMWKALQVLRRRGIVQGVKGHPFIVTPGERTFAARGAERMHALRAAAAQSCRTKSQRVADQMERDILNAAYSSGAPLPGIKELKVRYGCSYPTIRKSLETLRAKNVIMPGRGGYSVVPIPAVRASARIVFVGYSWETGALVLSPNEEDLLRVLELECLKANLRLDVAFFSSGGGGVTFTGAATGAPYDITDAQDVLGYVYLLTGTASYNEEVLSLLSRPRKPLAVIDETGDAAVPVAYRQSRMLKIFRTSTTARPPSLVARYLRDMGHTRAAYFSPFHKNEWSKLRLTTLRSVLEASVPGAVLKHYTLDDCSSPIDYLPAARRRCDVSPIARCYESLRQKLPVAFLEPVNPVLFNDNLEVILGNCEVSLRCEELFQRALSDRRITAWVGANDHIALLAQSFLQRNRVRVPGRISVIGFDDTRQAMKHGLTSYNFNYQGLVNISLNFILQRKGAPLQRSSTIEIDGFLSHRATSGPAR